MKKEKEIELKEVERELKETYVKFLKDFDKFLIELLSRNGVYPVVAVLVAHEKGIQLLKTEDYQHYLRQLDITTDIESNPPNLKRSYIG